MMNVNSNFDIKRNGIISGFFFYQNVPNIIDKGHTKWTLTESTKLLVTQ